VALGSCLLLALIAYAPALGNGFYNDDALFLNHAGRVLQQPTALLTERPLNYFRPVWGAWITMQRALFGLQASGYHAFGILLHGLVGFLVWRLARRLVRDSLAALAGALAFVAFFCQAEATLWISAHNSSLMTALMLSSVLCHLRAVRTGRMTHAVVTALVVAATLLTKEPGLFALVWMILAEAGLHGARSCVSRRGLLRLAVLLPVVLAYVLGNPRLTEAFVASDSLAQAGVRASLAQVTPDRLLGASAWLVSPFAHTPADLNLWWGVALLGGALLLVVWLRRELLVAALTSVAILLAGMIPACVTVQQHPSGSRLYYLPTVGAALLVACVVAAARSPDARRLPAGLARGLRVAVALLLVGYIALQVRAIHGFNARDYQLISRMQVRMVEQLGERLPPSGGSDVLLLEPWIENAGHLRAFLRLYHGVAPGRVTSRTVPRSGAKAWLEGQQEQDPGLLILDWSDRDGLVPATGVPSSRSSGQGMSRSAETGVRKARVRVIRIAPPRAG
jgi:hypothetical protein